MKRFDRKVGKRSSGRVAFPAVTTRLFLLNTSCDGLPVQLKNEPLGARVQTQRTGVFSCLKGGRISVRFWSAPSAKEDENCRKDTNIH
jgi:hypothetical protein